MSELIKLSVTKNLMSCKFCKYFTYMSDIYGDHAPDGTPVIRPSPYFCTHNSNNTEIYPIYGYDINEVTCDKHKPIE